MANDPEKGTIVALNSLYGKDPYFVKRGTFPINNSEELFIAACDGVLLSRLFMMIAPGVIPEKKLALDVDIAFLRQKIANKGRRGGDPNTRSVFQITQNLNAFNSSVSKVPETASLNITMEDILNLNTELIFHALKQLLRGTIVARVSILHRPEFVRLREEGENSDALMMLDSETLILRWVNFQLRKAGCRITASNLSSDFKDSEIFLQLLRQVAPPDAVDVTVLNAALSVPPSRNERPACVVETINKLGCAAGITFQELVMGDKSAILTCLAALIQLYPAIEFPTENEIKNLEIVVGDLRARVRDLEEELSVARRGKVIMEEMDQLSNQISSLTTENKKVKDELEFSKEQTERMRQENASLVAKMEALKSKQEGKIKDSMNQVDERFTGIQKSFEEMLQSKDKLIDDLQTRLKTSRDELAAKDKQIAEERKKNDPEAAAKLLMEMMSNGAVSAPTSPNPNDTRKREKEKEKEKDKEKEKEKDKEKDKERDKDKEKSLKKEKGGTLSKASGKKREEEPDVEKLKEALSVAEKKIKSLEEIVADLEDELKEEKEAFDNLITLQKKSTNDSKANARQSFYSHKETITTGKKKKEEHLLEETISLLTGVLGKEAEEFLSNEAAGTNAATKVKYLVEVLLDVKEQQTKKIASLEFQIEKNKEINDLMKEKVQDLALAQIKHKKFSRHHLLSLFGVGDKEKEKEKE